MHTYLLMLLLVIVLIREGTELQSAGLLPYYSPLAYVAVGMSLGYMSMTLPWSLRMYYGNEQERNATRPTLIVHHFFVVLAELVYVLTLTSPWHGLLAFVFFEFSNLFLMPHHLMTQYGYHGKLHFINGLLFFLSCTLVRVGGCVVLGVFYIVDVVSIDVTAVGGTQRDADTAAASDYGAGLFVALSLSLISFWVILALSCYWYAKDVLSEVHKEFKMSFGETYWRRCCPCAPKFARFTQRVLSHLRSKAGSGSASAENTRA